MKTLMVQFAGFEVKSVNPLFSSRGLLGHIAPTDHKINDVLRYPC